MIAVNTNKCLQVYSQERDGNTDAKLTEDSDSQLVCSVSSVFRTIAAGAYIRLIWGKD